MTNDREKSWIEAATRIPNVLLVDDDPAIVNTLLSWAKKFYVKMDEALDGMSAIERFDSADYLAILLDLSLPGVGGIEVFKYIRAKSRDIPIGIISGGIPEAQSAELLRYGRFTHLPKPFQEGLKDMRGWLMALGVKEVTVPASESRKD